MCLPRPAWSQVALEGFQQVDPDDISIDFGRGRFDRRRGNIAYDATVTNLSGAPLQGLVLVIDNISSPNVSVANPDDSAPSGAALVNLSDLTPGESTTRSIVFSNPRRARFTFDSFGLVPAQDSIPPAIDIGAPADGAVVNASPITVAGTIDDDTATVTVNGVPATVSAGLYSAVVPLAEGGNTVTAEAVDPAGNTAAASISVLLDTTPPLVEITSPADGAVFDASPITVTGTLDDDTAAVTVNGVPATVSAGLYSAVVPLAEGGNTVTAEAVDPAGNTAAMSISVLLDTAPPLVEITSPADGAVFDASPITVAGTIDDDTAAVTVNGVPATVSAGLYSAVVPLAEGGNTVTAEAVDPAGNTAAASISVLLDSTPPIVGIASPADGAAVGASPVTVSGTLDDDTATVTVNGVPATVSAGAYSAVVPLAEGGNTVTAEAVDPAGNTAAASISVLLDTTPPIVEIVSPAEGAVVTASPITIEGTVDDDTATVDVNGIPATVSGGTFAASGVPLAEGANIVTATTTDPLGNLGTDSITVTLEPSATDTTPPAVTVTLPTEGDILFESRPPINAEFSDASGVDTATFEIGIVNGAFQPLPADCSFTPTSADCVPTADLPDGAVIIEVRLDDVLGNTGTATRGFTIDAVPIGVTIATPADGLITTADEVVVTGTVDSGIVTVEVNGVPAALSGTDFSASVPLREGTNMLVAVATNTNGKTGTDSVEVTRDIFAPVVRIDSPRADFTSTTDTVAVTGLVNDIVNGATDPRVVVNGIEAEVSDGSFLVVDLPLVRGPNTIEAVATDAVGNEGRDSITVTFQPPVGARLSIASGNGQSAPVRSTLTEPLVVEITDDLGNPVSSKVVTFQVTRNNGTLTPAGQPLSTPMRSVQVPTDGSGRAAAIFDLGDTSGGGANRVVATALGVAGEIEFCATGVAGAPDTIRAGMGDNQRGTIGQPLATPLEAVVIDVQGNPIRDFEVTFTVVRGGGSLDGASSLVRRTGTDGIARAVLTLGPNAGINNNVVNATYAGLTGLPATYTASGLAPGDPAETRLAGVVLDNGQTPVPEAIVSIEQTSLTTVTDANGQFLLSGVPVGHVLLHIDPSLSPRPETFPPLEFETVTVAGQRNTIGQPILLPALDTDASKIVGGAEDVTLFMPNVPGLELTVFAGSVTFPDGAPTGRLIISQVHLDKVPMPPPNGTMFMAPAWTIQPHGVKFDPPARISIPNDGLPPGRMIDIFQFDHAVNEFINVGKGTVDEEGFAIVTDPGFGVTRAGWGGGAQPPPITCASGCDDGNPCTIDKCENNACVHRNKPDGVICQNSKDDIFLEMGVKLRISSSCSLGRCKAGKCKPKSDRWGANLKSETKDAIGKIFGTCMGEPLRTTMQNTLKARGFLITCVDSTDATGDGNRDCGGASVGGNKLTIGTQSASRCGRAAKTVRHEMQHGAGGRSHSEVPDTLFACDLACYGVANGPGNPKNCK